MVVQPALPVVLVEGKEWYKLMGKCYNLMGKWYNLMGKWYNLMGDTLEILSERRVVYHVEAVLVSGDQVLPPLP